MLETFFPESHYKDILHRKLDISYIKQYQREHNNRFPPDSNNCMSNVVSFIFNTTNKYRYDYDYKNYISFRFNDMARNIIRKYDNNFTNITFRFNLKNLSKKTENDIINEMDELYVHFNTYSGGSNSNRASRASRASRTRGSSKTNLNRQGVSARSINVPRSRQSSQTNVTKSILRTSSSLRFASSNTTVIKILPVKPLKQDISVIDLNEKAL